MSAQPASDAENCRAPLPPGTWGPAPAAAASPSAALEFRSDAFVSSCGASLSASQLPLPERNGRGKTVATLKPGGSCLGGQPLFDKSAAKGAFFCGRFAKLDMLARGPGGCCETGLSPPKPAFAAAPAPRCQAVPLLVLLKGPDALPPGSLSTCLGLAQVVAVCKGLSSGTNADGLRCHEYRASTGECGSPSATALLRLP
mmetsp:Transcript_22846/g.53429  ORF Transcript_22846/g.53429 Transcript_22846/m.53429 type:complete len:200 (-) Transcript_22846:319-918(-)